MRNGIYEVTVQRGEDIKKVLTDFVLSHEWKNVYVTGAVGSVIDVELTTPCRNYLPLKCKKIQLQDAAEMLQLCGEIMPIENMDPDLSEIYPDKDSPLFVHLHTAVAVNGGQVFGGGFYRGNAFRSLRIFMIPLDEQNDDRLEITTG